MSRTHAAAVSLIAIVAVFLPIRENFRSQPRDGFPLSHYPMFSGKYGETQKERYVVGVDAQGRRRFISHRLVGPGGGNQVRKQLRKTVDTGGKALTDLCRKVARRVSRSSDASLAPIVEIRIVRGEFRVEDYFGRGTREPREEKVYCTCRVKRVDS